MSNSGFFGFGNTIPAAIADGATPATYATHSDPRAASLYDFLGAPNRYVPTDAYSHRSRTNETLLDAYDGRNAMLSGTVEGLILADNEAYTLIILPWVYTDEKHFTLNKIEFNRTLPGPTPHEGTSRLLTSSKSSESFTSHRHGIKYRLEGDFAGTAQGEAAHFRSLVQASLSVQELAKYVVVEFFLSMRIILTLLF